ncbi:NAD-dependent epimerase/dehydratase family protein [Enhydrobacter aerosaccus]|nr:NAD-dependent epimerase/dehydratase family protein [Enhydrobacter aerosaccus]
MITGAGGMVGTTLARHLAREGFTNLIPVYRDECDLSDRESTERLFAQTRPEHVFHAAGRVYGILGNMLNQGLSFYDNVVINTNVVEAARKYAVEKITVMGTGAVYPYPPPGVPLKEDMIHYGVPHASERAYANAKRAMLMMLEAYQESYGLRWAYVVSCNLFGPHDRFDVQLGHVVPSLIKKFHDARESGTDVVVWGDGSARRDFMYSRDAARAFQTIMEEVDGPVNLGSGNVLSIGEIVAMIGKISGMTDRIRWDRTKPNGQEYRKYDLSRIGATSFRCRFSIADGLRETWEWYCTEERHKTGPVAPAARQAAVE